MAIQRKSSNEPPHTVRWKNARREDFTYYCAEDIDWQLTLFRHLFTQLPVEGLRRLLRRLRAGEVWLGGHLMAPMDVNVKPGPMMAWLTDTEIADLRVLWLRGATTEGKKKLWALARDRYGIEDLATDADAECWPGTMYEACFTSDPEDLVWVVQGVLVEKERTK